MMVQRRRELTPMDLLKGAASQLGPFGANLAVGLQKTSVQVGPAVRQLSALAKRELEATRSVEPTSPGPPLRGLGTKGLVPIGAGLRQIEQEILQQRPIGTPQIIDRQDAISGRSEGELQRYVKEALRAMPIGTDTSVDPQVTVLPRNMFHQRLVQMGGNAISPAVTEGKDHILVSDELFDLSPKERRAIVAHEVYHSRKHGDFMGKARYAANPPWAEREAHEFERQVEPEGSAAANARYARLAQQQGLQMQGLHPTGMMVR